MYEYLIIFIFGHIIGDFYLQTNKMAENKNTKCTYFLLHCFLYAVALIIFCLPIWNTNLVVPIIVLILSHLIIDLLKAEKIKSKLKAIKNCSSWIFFIDQLIHFLFLIAMAIYIDYNGVEMTVQGNIQNILNVIGLSYIQIIGFALVVFINAKPYNIAIKNLAKQFKPQSDSTEEGNNHSTKIGAGALIGTLERYIVTALCALSQYSAIGFVLTAKSIARYNKISDEEGFAEYYLMGTLMSTMLAILTYIGVKAII